MKNEKIKILAKFLGVKEGEIQEISFSESLFKKVGNQLFKVRNWEYLVLTEEEKEKKIKEYITNNLWAFNTGFILSHTNIGLNPTTEKAMQKMQKELHEDANEIIKALIKNMDEFIENAVNARGAGHFLDKYDGSEKELNGFYIYRIYRTN